MPTKDKDTIEVYFNGKPIGTVDADRGRAVAIKAGKVLTYEDMDRLDLAPDDIIRLA